MAKKWMAFGMALVMLLGVFGMAGCGARRSLSLEEYKTMRKEELQIHADKKGESNYSTGNWDDICSMARIGKESVDRATDKFAVDALVNDFKNIIDGIYTKVETEKLEEEFKKRLNDLAIPISDAYRLEILNIYRSWASSEYGRDYRHVEVQFYYYGQYNEFHILKITGGWVFGLSHTEYIDGFNFSYPGCQEIYAVRSDMVGGTLKEIYEAGYLTRNDLEAINKIHLRVFADFFDRLR